MSPYADFSSLHTWAGFRFIALRSSSTGSMARTRFSWVFPCKKAARISKLLMLHPIEQMSWVNNIFYCFPKVGLSLGIVSIWGS